MRFKRMPEILSGILNRGFLFLSVLFFLLAVFYLSLAINLTEAIWAAIVSSVLTAFFTATFNSWVNRKESRINKRVERFKRHYDTLVELEHERVEFGSILDDNLFILRQFTKSTNNRRIIPFYPKPLPRSLGSLRNLLDLDLINQMADLYNDARKFNDDTEGLRGSIDEWRAALINGPKDKESLMFYFDRMTELNNSAMETVLRAGNRLVDKNIYLNAILRERLEADTAHIQHDIKKEVINKITPIDHLNIDQAERDIRKERIQRTKEREKELDELFKDVRI